MTLSESKFIPLFTKKENGCQNLHRGGFNKFLLLSILLSGQDAFLLYII